jgi:hypothetical protein
MKRKFLLTDCQNLAFSHSLSQNRMQRAVQALSEPVVRRVLCYSLYLLGINRQAVGQSLGIPPDTAKSIIKAVEKKGLSAFEDRRHRTSVFLPPAPTPLAPVTLSVNKEHVVVDFGAEDRCLRIPRQNELQVRTVLLSLCNSGMLAHRQVAQVIGLTPAYTATLARQLASEDVPSLVDKREGQKSDYSITPEVKAELVQQFAVHVLARARTSGRAISDELQKRCELTIPPRTVRYHLERMGLAKIKHSLPKLVDAVKKTSKISS